MTHKALYKGYHIQSLPRKLENGVTVLHWVIYPPTKSGVIAQIPMSTKSENNIHSLKKAHKFIDMLIENSIKWV